MKAKMSRLYRSHWKNEQIFDMSHLERSTSSKKTFGSSFKSAARDMLADFMSFNIAEIE